MWVSEERTKAIDKCAEAQVFYHEARALLSSRLAALIELQNLSACDLPSLRLDRAEAAALVTLLKTSRCP